MRRPKAYTAMHRVADAAAPKLATAIRETLDAVGKARLSPQAVLAGFAGGTVSHVVHGIDWNGLQNDLTTRLQAILLTTVHRATLAASQAVVKADRPTIPDDFTRTNPLTLRWAQRHAAELALNLSAETHQAVRTMVVQMLEDGIPPQAAATRLQSVVGLSRRYTQAVLTYTQSISKSGKVPPSVVTELSATYAKRLARQRAEMIARTESLRAAVKGQQLLWQQQIEAGTLNPDRIRQVWLVTPDDRLCPTCAAIPGAENVLGGGSPDNQPPVGEPFYVPATGEYIDGPPQHPSCVIGDTHITTSECVTAHSQRWYEGEVIHIRTRRGYQLTCTPNHPILTGRGWVAAGELHETDDLICHTIGDNPSFDLADQDVHPRIEQIADAVRQSGLVVSRPMPVTAEDFHGDGTGSEVAVVWAYRGLGDSDNAPSEQEGAQQGFCGIEACTDFNSLRLPAQDTQWGGTSAVGRMSAGGLAVALRGVHVGPFDALSHTPATRLDAVLQQETTHGAASDANMLSQLLFGASGEVVMDQLVRIERRPFTGHVFNLETRRGIYGANGIITHNCRCDVALIQADADGFFPLHPQAPVSAYAGADAPPASRVLAPRVPLRYR